MRVAGYGLRVSGDSHSRGRERGRNFCSISYSSSYSSSYSVAIQVCFFTEWAGYCVCYRTVIFSHQQPENRSQKTEDRIQCLRPYISQYGLLSADLCPRYLKAQWFILQMSQLTSTAAIERKRRTSWVVWIF